ncbi:MAG: hypothetical protein ACPLW9_02535 [Minisyncoccales bacterium]
MNKQKIILLSLIIILLAGCLGLGIKLYLAQKQISWYEQVLSRFYPPLAKEVKSFSGRIVEKGEDYLVVATHVRVLQFPVPDGKELEKRNIKVKVAAATEISREASPESWVMGWEAPQTAEEKITLADLQLNDLVLVNSQENILATNEVTGQTIKFLAK